MINCCSSPTETSISIIQNCNNPTSKNQNSIPCTVDNDYIMICSPVGNQNKFLKSNPQIQADIVFSGYCTAPDAAKSYIADICMGIEDPELKNSFNTPTMRSGIKFLMSSLGMKEEEIPINHTKKNKFSFRKSIQSRHRLIF